MTHREQCIDTSFTSSVHQSHELFFKCLVISSHIAVAAHSCSPRLSRSHNMGTSFHTTRDDKERGSSCVVLLQPSVAPCALLSCSKEVFPFSVEAHVCCGITWGPRQRPMLSLSRRIAACCAQGVSRCHCRETTKELHVVNAKAHAE